MRAILIVLDSVGIGGAPDAADYGDEGANTLGHIYEKVPDLAFPNLDSLGLGQALRRSSDTAGVRDGASFGWMSATARWAASNSNIPVIAPFMVNALSSISEQYRLNSAVAHLTTHDV